MKLDFVRGTREQKIANLWQGQSFYLAFKKKIIYFFYILNLWISDEEVFESGMFRLWHQTILMNKK